MTSTEIKIPLTLLSNNGFFGEAITPWGQNIKVNMDLCNSTKVDNQDKLIYKAGYVVAILSEVRGMIVRDYQSIYYVDISKVSSLEDIFFLKLGKRVLMSFYESDGKYVFHQWRLSKLTFRKNTTRGKRKLNFKNKQASKILPFRPKARIA